MNRKEPTVSTQKKAIPLSVFDSSNLFVAPRDPATKAAAIGLSPVVRDAVSPQQSPPTKKRVDFAGGFKVPEEVMQRQLEKKRPLEYDRDDLEDVGGDNQLTREDIMAQLNLNQNASKYSGNKLGASKEQTKKDLIFGVDKEMEKLKRQAQNISMRREMARRIEEGGKPKDTNEPSPAEIEAGQLQKDIRALDPVHNIIHAHPERVQVIRHKISNLGLENLNPEQIEQLRKKHELEMKEVEEQYFKKKQSQQLLRKYQSGSSSYHDQYRQSNLTSGDNSPRRYQRPPPRTTNYVAPIRISGATFADLPAVTGHSPGKIDPRKPLKPEERDYVDKYMRYKRRKSRDERRQSESPTRQDFDLYTSGPDSPSRKGKELKEMLKEQQKPGNMDYRPTRKLFEPNQDYRQDFDGSVNGSTFERAEGPVHLSHLGDNDGTQPAVKFADPIVEMSPPRREKSAHQRGKKKELRPAQKKAFHLLKWIFNSIDTEQRGVIAKARLVEEVKKGHDQILAVFSSTSAVQLERKFQRQRTGDPLSFTWEEFVEMALDQYDTSGLLKSVSPKKRLQFEDQEDSAPVQDKGTRLLCDELFSKIKELYQETDKYDDHVVKRKDLLFNLRTNPDVVSDIDADAVLTEELGVKMTLDEVLAEVEFDEREERKRKQNLADPVITREYITWNQFKDYFEKYRPRAERNGEDQMEELAQYRGTQYKVPMELLPSQLRYGAEKESQVEQMDPEDVIEVNYKVMDQFKDAFDKIVEEQGAIMGDEGEEEVDTLELLIGIRNIPDFKNFELNHARSPTQKSIIVKRERVQDVLERIEEQWTLKSGISWRQFEAHFTRWGVPRERPQSPEQDVIPVLESAQTPNFVSHKGKIETIKEASPEEEWTQEIKTRKEKTQKRSRSQGDKKGVSIKEAAEKGDLSQVRLELKDYEKQRDRSLPSRGRPSSSQPPAITVPRPFSFMQRDSSKTRSIREMKLAEMIAEKQAEEDAIVNYQFRHKEPPPQVTNKRYRALMQAEQQRREEVRLNSQAILKSKEKPFSFYLREKEKEAQREKEDGLPDAMRYPPFKAKEIPKAVQSQLYKKMDDQEEKKRKQRISHNAQISFAKAKLPRRMEMHEKMKKQQQELGLVRNKALQHSFKPKITKEVPDFDLKYKQFMQQLEKKRQQKRGTEMKPFHFNECKKSLGLRKYMDEYNQDKGNTINNELAAGAGAKQLIGVAKNIKAISQQPAIMPATTRKTEEMRAKRRKEMEESRKQEEDRNKAKQMIIDKFSKKSEIFERVKQSDALVDNTKKLEEKRKQQLQDKKEYFKEQDRMYQQKKKEMYDKVKKRPLLMEMATQKKSGMLAQMKELKKVRDTMRKNGVDPEKFMTPEELDKAEDAAFLEKHGKA